MSEDSGLIMALRIRISELEDKVDALRISRRVLMNLIDKLEQEKKDQLTRLETQNDQLKRLNLRYAKALMDHNIRINELEELIRNQSICGVD